MRRNGILFGGFLVLLGLLLFLSNLGVISVDVWSLIGPILLIALGAWLLWAVLTGRRAVEVEEAEVPLQGATRADLRLNHAAGRLRIADGAAHGLLLSGSFGGGVDKRIRAGSDGLQVELGLPSSVYRHFIIPWSTLAGRGGLEWSIALTRDIPLTLTVHSGASETRLDLSALKVVDLRVETGASSTEIILPTAAGFTRVQVSSGAASTIVDVPDGVAARIKASGGLADINVAPRFPRLSAGLYQSPDYDTAADKVELTVETGVGAVHIR